MKLISTSIVNFLLLLCLFVAIEDAKKAAGTKGKVGKPGKGKKEDDGGMSGADAAKEIAKVVSDADAKSEKKREEMYQEMKKAPKDLMNAESMEQAALAAMLKSKPGNRELIIHTSKGFDGKDSFQPPSLKVKQTVKLDKSKKKKDSDEKTKDDSPNAPFFYPQGLGPVLMSGCMQDSYSKTSPCFNSKQHFLQKGQCYNQLDAGNFIGVGFNGRGYYSSESRRSSLVQRVCAAGSYFLDAQVPDNMNCYGIYDTKVETKSYQSLHDYMKELRKSAGVSDSSSMFHAEAEKMQKSYASGGDFGVVGALTGAAIGAYAAGPAGAAAGAALGGAIGSTIGFGIGSGSGSSNSKKNAKSNANFDQQDQANKEKKTTNSFLAVMSVNILLFEIALDEVAPEALSFAFLQDYTELPRSYHALGAVEKYQNFLNRWGTHYIRSAKMGGQLRITKTSKNTKQISADKFASVAQKEFQAMFSNLEQSYSQKKTSWKFLGFGETKSESEQNAKFKQENKANKKLVQKSEQSQKTSESDFTQTNVEAVGGDPDIANAVVDFYTPSFRDTFSAWIKSIFDYPKPISFTLKSISDLLNIKMSSLFPSGSSIDFGCNSTKIKLFEDSATKDRYYFTDVYENIGGKTIKRKEKVICKYKNLDDFQNSFKERYLSLEKAISVYLKEGPTPISTFDLQGGKPGCESNSLRQIEAQKSSEVHLKWDKMKNSKFYVIFDVAQDIPYVTTKRTKFLVTRIKDLWFTLNSAHQKLHMYAGCHIPPALTNQKVICVNNLLLLYNSNTGTFTVTKETLYFSRLIIPTLPIWLLEATVAKAEPYNLLDYYNSNHLKSIPMSFPCNVKWSNTHKLNPDSNYNCIHFTAATKGNIFVLFASIPRKISTWYYLQLSSYGVAYYKGGILEKADITTGVGILGDPILYETYFACVRTFDDGDVDMQFGKSQPGSNLGKVHSAYIFQSSQKKRQVLTFYAFGAGTDKISFNDVRLASRLPILTCPSDDYELLNGRCILNCHKECSGCKAPKDNTECHSCKHYRLQEYEQAGRTVPLMCVAKCPKGYEPNTRIKNMCVKCERGYFKNKESNDKCKACLPGTYVTEKGSSECKMCKEGTYCGKKGCIVCLPCAIGWFADEEGRSHCHRCFKGTYAPTPKTIKCKNCNPGTYTSEIGQPACKKCKPDTYAAKYRTVKCTVCPKGTGSMEGSSSCQNNCKPGSFSPKKGVACRECIPGYYTPSTGSIKCLLCKAGTYASSAGSKSCKSAPVGFFVPHDGAYMALKCAKGTYSDATGKTQCKLCKSGTYSSKGVTKCRSCAKGQYNKQQGMSSCSLCPPGTYGDKTGLTTCKICGAGMYNSKLGRESCNRCEPGYFSNKGGSSRCNICSHGLHSSGGATSCTACPKGMYSGSNKQCVKCPAGQYNSGKGKSSCTPCPVGHYQNAEGSTSCKKCSPGYYQNKTGQTSCSKCPAGKYSQTGYSNCRNCGHGQYQPNLGSSTCLSCPKGTHNDQFGRTACKPCPIGRYTYRVGRTGCSACPAGTHQQERGKWFCHECTQGHYSNRAGRPRCSRCASGYYQNKKRQSKCHICPAGKISSGGAAWCGHCGPGTGQHRAGQNHCGDCPAGYYSNKSFNAHCHPCPRGHYQNHRKQSSCKACGIGHYQPDTGKSFCHPCPRDHYININGATGCHKCTWAWHSDPGWHKCKFG